MLEPVLIELALLFALCVAVAVAFHRLRLPPVVAFLVTGAVVGPHSLALVKHEDTVRQLAEVGIVALLFAVGVELPFTHLARLRRAIVVGGGLQIGLTIVACAGACVAAGIPFNQSVFLGLLLSLSSTAVVTKLLGERGEFGSPHGRAAMGISLAQDLAMVPMILLVPVLAGDAAPGGGALGRSAMQLVWLAVTIVVARLLVPRILDLVARTRSQELFVLTLCTLCLALASVTAHLGMSLALGAFLAGVLVADSDHRHGAAAEVEPFRDALSALFFVSIGMLFDWRAITATPGLVLVALLAVVGGKAVVVVAVAKVLGLPAWFRLRTALSVAQVGEFSFVLVQVARGGGLLPPRVEQIFVVVAVLSIAVTPLLYGLGGWLAQRARRGTEVGRSSEAGSLRDHAVVVGFGPAGQTLASALRTLGIPHVVVEMNAATVKEHKAAGVPIVLGDATRNSVLRTAGVSRARVLVLAINDAEAGRRTVALARSLAPNLHVVARVTYLAEAPLFRRAGAQEIVPAELETSVEIMVRVLRRFLVPDDAVLQLVRTARAAVDAPKVAAIDRPDAGRIAEYVPGIGVAIHRVEAGSVAAARSLAEVGVRRNTGCSVVAVRRGGENLPIVTPETVLAADDVVVVIGPESRLADAAAMFAAAASSEAGKTTIIDQER